MEIRFYRTDDGKEPALDYIRSLNDKQAQKVAWVLETIRGFEGIVPAKWLKKLTNTDGIWEIRVEFEGISSGS